MKILLKSILPVMMLASFILVGARGQTSPPFTSGERVRLPEQPLHFEPLVVTGNRPAATPVKKAVLLLFPYQSDLPYSMLAVQAIREEFDSATDLTLDLYYEYLDLNRFPGDAYRQQLLSLYAAKYRGKSIDLVLIADEVMLNLWLERRAEILPDTPVVFYDILTGRLAGRQLPPDVTGVSAVVDYTQSVNWVLQARPSVDEIVIVHGVGEADRQYMYAVDEMRDALRGRVRFTDLSDLPLAEIKRRVAVLPQSSIVLYHLMFEDASGARYRPIDVLRELAGVSPVPVICGYDQFIGTGALGGYVYSIDQQARVAARAGLRILRGEPASAIPITTGQGNRFMFDYPVLQRYAIPLSTLPPESIVKNREPSFWERYRLEAITIGAAFLILILLVVYLAGLTRRLNTTRLALSRLNASLEAQVQERTAALSQTNRRLEAEIGERRQAETALLASEARYRLLADSAPLAVTVTDVETSEVAYINPLAAELFEMTVAQALGTRAPDYYGDPHERERLVQQLTAQGRINDFEIQLKKRSGREFWASITATLSIFENRPAIHTVYLDITERKQAEAERERLIAELQGALTKVKQLEGILPICSFCKRIRDEDGTWQPMETYIGNRSRVEFSHGFCPDCGRKYYPQYFAEPTEE
jgi:PAS domain S-box-containing protein